MSEPQRIAVFLPNWVGDVVMATPALRALRARFPAAHITYFGRPAPLATLDSTPWADSMLDLTTPAAGKIRSLWQGAARVRRIQPDLAVLMPNSFRSAFLARLGGAGRIVGYNRDGRGWLLSDRLSPPRRPDGSFAPRPMIEYYNALAKALGCDDPGHRMQLPLSQEAQDEARTLWRQSGLEGHAPVVMLNPGGAFGPSKMWQPERYAHLADALIDQAGARIVLNAAPNEKPIALRVEEAMEHEPHLSFARRDNSLPLLGSLVRRCDLMVTNDTGARHFAVALGVRVVTLFGSTDPRWTDLFTARERIVRVELPCSPCQERICPQPAGPLYHKCMFDISVQQVLRVCLEQIAKPAEATP
jgi:heptosyltransferase-2